MSISMLTITISIASSADALFSFLPIELQPFKIFTQIALIFALIFLNLRGVKESVLFLLPIFLLFIVMVFLAIAANEGGRAPSSANAAAELLLVASPMNKLAQRVSLSHLHSRG